jgi:hypothetical protein
MQTADSSGCARLTEILARLPLGTYETEIPNAANGVYFFYEAGETCADHGTEGLRIVRVGTDSTEGKLRRRMRNHYRGGSRFRRLLCRAMARKSGRWEEWMGVLSLSSDRRFPLDIQQAVTSHMETNCWYRWLPCDTNEARLDLEKRCIGSIAQCARCGPSEHWLGRHAYEPAVRESGLWNSHHVSGKYQLSDEDLEWIEDLVTRVLYVSPELSSRTRSDLEEAPGSPRL